MLTQRELGQIPVWLAMIGLLVPITPSHSAQGTEPSTFARDIVLSAGGRLTGHYVDLDGSPIEAAVVSLRQEGREVSRAVTNAEGRFEFCGVQAGSYELTAGEALQPIRTWVAEAAPPIAATAAVLTPAVVRGQWGPGESMGIVFGLVGIGLGTIALVQVHNLSEKVDRHASP